MSMSQKTGAMYKYKKKRFHAAHTEGGPFKGRTGSLLRSKNREKVTEKQDQCHTIKLNKNKLGQDQTKLGQS